MRGQHAAPFRVHAAVEQHAGNPGVREPRVQSAIERLAMTSSTGAQIAAGLDGRPCVLSLDPGVAERLGMTVQTLENFYPIAATRYAQVSRRYDVV